MISFLKHKRNYDKRVGARIISQKIKTMKNPLFIEKHYSKPTVITHVIIAFSFCVFVFNEFEYYCLFIHFSIENDENEATGNEIIHHNYLKVGGCLN